MENIVKATKKSVNLMDVRLELTITVIIVPSILGKSKLKNIKDSGTIFKFN
jgi:hypothetical protein